MPVIGHGVEVCTSITRPTTGITAGSLIYETDTQSYRWYNGSAWLGMIPEGTIQSYAGASAPTGWLLCFGQTLNSITSPEYAPLFNVIGTTYGGSGASSFVVPDLRGRSAFGKDNMGGSTASRVTSTSGIVGTTLGATGGDQRIQDHTHTFSGTTGNDSPDHTHGYSRAINTGFRHANDNNNLAYFHTYDGPQTGGASTRHTHGFSGTTANHNQTTGGAAQNMPPAIILNYIIKY